MILRMLYCKIARYFINSEISRHVQWNSWKRGSSYRSNCFFLLLENRQIRWGTIIPLIGGCAMGKCSSTFYIQEWSSSTDCFLTKKLEFYHSSQLLAFLQNMYNFLWKVWENYHIENWEDIYFPGCERAAGCKPLYHLSFSGMIIYFVILKKRSIF